jgi:DNA-directed RNA polymerase specialized sigma24 family protein
LVLRYYEDLPDADIARLLGCAPATVRVHAHHGLERLRATLRPVRTEGKP